MDPETNEKYLPYAIEHSVGLDRLFLAVLCDAYDKEILADGDEREVLHLLPALAPYKVTILPLIKKVHAEKAKQIFGELCSEFPVSYDETGSIGKRYRRSDAIGTPFAITIDDETLANDTVTLRDRDTMEQITIHITRLKGYIEEKLKL